MLTYKHTIQRMPNPFALARDMAKNHGIQKRSSDRYVYHVFT